MTADDPTLTNAGINSGNPVTLLSGNITYEWKNITRVDPIEGDYDIVETHYGGFENPKIIVDGFFDADNEKSDDETETLLTHALLVDFALIKTGTTTLKVSFGSTPFILGGRPTAGYSTAGANTLDTTNGIDVQVDNFSISSSTSIRYGRRVNFKIEMHETK